MILLEPLRHVARVDHWHTAFVAEAQIGAWRRHIGRHGNTEGLIPENLHRADLTALERSEHIAEWVKLADGVSAHVAPKLSTRGRSGEGRPESGINAAARELGVDRTEAQRAAKVASLSPEAKQAARDTGRDDNRAALLQAAKQPPEKQAEAIQSRSCAADRPPTAQLLQM